MAGLSWDEFLCFAIALGHRGWFALVKGSKEDGQRNIPEELEYPFELGDVCNVWTAPEDQSGSISFTLLLWERRGHSKGGKAFSVLILSEFAIYFLQFYFKEKMSLNNMVYTYYFILKMSLDTLGKHFVKHVNSKEQTVLSGTLISRWYWYFSPRYITYG